MNAPGVRRAAPRRRSARSLVVAFGPFHDRLLWYVLLASALGAALPRVAGHLEGAVPVMLAGQVAGVALTLTWGQLRRVLRRPGVVIVALGVQWAVVAPAGVLLGRGLGSGTTGAGIVVCAVVPAEITSALVAVLAGGAGEVAVACMAGSLAIGTLLTPLWLTAGLGDRAHVDQAALLLELGLSVTLPLVVGVALRSRVTALAGQAPRCLDLAAVCVVLVVFVAAGRAEALIWTWTLPAAAGACLLLQALSYAGGLAVGQLVRASRPVRRAVLFPVGMREFGIAIAVALTVAPDLAAVGGIYGVLVMVTGPALAMRLRRRQHPSSPPVGAADVPASA